MKYTDMINRLEKAHLLRRIYSQRVDSPLHCSQVPIMKYISEHEGCTQIDVAEKLQVTAACIAASTKKLQKSGYITKTVDETNLRCKRLRITPLGQQVLDEGKIPFEEYDKLVFRNISDEEMKNAAVFLDKLIYNMEEAIGESHKETDFYDVDRLVRKVHAQKEEKMND
ncbi:MAG: MarR family winged helix-turn-helix transcriptional regulator [Porcipelethomonas sp.]